jgi:hypothetical protein
VTVTERHAGYLVENVGALGENSISPARLGDQQDRNPGLGDGESLFGVDSPLAKSSWLLLASRLSARVFFFCTPRLRLAPVDKGTEPRRGHDIHCAILV